MQQLQRSYTSLDGDVQRVSVAWRITAFSSSWLILIGFFSLYPFFDKHPEIRGSIAIPAILASTFLSAGFGLTVISYLVNRNPSFRKESLFLPCFSSSSVALVAIFYNLGVSERLVWNAAALVYIGVSTAATILFGFLYVFTSIPHRASLPEGHHMSVHVDTPPEKYHSLKPYPRVVSVAPPTSNPFMHPEEQQPLAGQPMNMNMLRVDHVPGDEESSTSAPFDMPAPPRNLRRVGNSSIELPKHVMDYYDDSTSPNAVMGAALGVDMGDHGGRTSSSSRYSRRGSQDLLSREERRAQIEAGR